MADPNQALSDRELLFQAAELNDQVLMKNLVNAKKMNASLADYSGRTPAHIAAMYGHLDIIKFLLEKDPSIIALNDQNEESVLIKAITFGHLNVVKYLVEDCQLSISERYGHRHSGNTAIHFATANGRLETLKYFIEERNGNVNIENDLRETPLFLAAENKLYRIIQYLIEERGADATKINSKGYNVLFKAVETDDLGLIKYLLEIRKIPFDLNWRAFQGDSLVHRAVELNRESVLVYLVSEKHARVNITDELGETPLHKAAGKNNYRVCRFLVELGADVTVENENGKLPVDKATDRRLIKYLMDEVNDMMRYRRSVLEPSIPDTPVPASSHGASSERIAENPNSHSSAALYAGVHRASPPQLQSFLTIALAMVRNHGRSLHRPAERSSLLSPQEEILNRVDSVAIKAIWRVPSLPRVQRSFYATVQK